MGISIHSQGFDLGADIHRRIKQQLARRMGRIDDEVMSVEVYLSDVKGPRGGDKDKKSVMRACLAGLPPVSVTAVHGRLEVAIDRSAWRLKRAVVKATRRQRRIEARKVRKLHRWACEANPI